MVTPTKKKKIEFEQTDDDLVPSVHCLHGRVRANDVEDGPTEFGK